MGGLLGGGGGGRAVMRGEGCRVEGWTRRAMGLLAMVVEGPMLAERGWRGREGLWLAGRGGGVWLCWCCGGGREVGGLVGWRLRFGGRGS